MNSDSASFTSSTANTLDNISLSGGLNIGDGFVNIADSLAFASGSLFDLNNGTMSFSGTQTFDNATVQPSAAGNILVANNSTLTLGANTKISGGTAVTIGGKIPISNTSRTLINNGLIDATQSGSAYNISPDIFTNNGTIEGAAGATITIDANSTTNTGTITGIGAVSVSGGALANSGTIHSDSNLALGNGGETPSTFTNSGQISSAGDLTITGSSLTNTASAAPITVGGNFLGNIITGGTINVTGQADAGIVQDCDLTADGLRLQGGMEIDTSSGGSLTLTGDKDIQFYNPTSGLVLTGNNTLSGATITFSSTGSNYAGNYNQLFVGNNSTLTLDAQTTLSGGSNTVTETIGGSASTTNNTIINDGKITDNVAGCTYTFNVANLTNNGTIEVSNGATMRFQIGDFVNNGTVRATGTGTHLVDQETGNDGILFVGDGASAVTEASPFANTGQFTIGVNGNFQASNGISQSGAGSQTQVDGTLLMRYGRTDNVTLLGGLLNGTGTVEGNVVNTSGTIKPGDSPGTLTITDNGTGKDGAYTQGPSGTFLEELGGASAGDFDVLNVSSLAALNGSLDVSLVNGYAPILGQTFTFLNYGSLTGAFSSVVGLDAGYGYSMAYGANSASLTVTSVAAAPEPSVVEILGLGFLALTGLCIKARRRQEA